MKTLGFILVIGLLLTGIALIGFTKEQDRMNKIKILETATDERGLTSVVYIDLKGDTVGLDYLTYHELCNLK